MQAWHPSCFNSFVLLLFITLIMRIPFYLSFLLIFLSLARSQFCYWPNGERANAYYPISPDSPNCCWNLDRDNRDLPFSNGLCWSNHWGFIYRGACTDAKWSSDSGCAQLCLNCKSSQRSSSCAEQSIDPKLAQRPATTQE